MPMQMTPHYWQLFTSLRDRPAVAASLNMALARIQERYNHLCMILNPNKTEALVISRSRTANHSHGNFVLFEVSIHTSPNLDIQE